MVPYMERHPSHNLLPHISPRHMSPLPGFPAKPPRKEAPIPRAFFYTSWFPYQSFRKDRCSVSGALLLLFLTVPHKRIPSPGSPTGLLRRQPFTDPSRSHPLKIYLSLRAPGKEAPSCSLKGTPWTGIIRHQSYWSTHSFFRSLMSAGVPKK